MPAKPRVRPLASVVLPAFNEESVIYPTVMKLDEMCLRRSEWRWEIIVIDDGSCDTTSLKAAEAAAHCNTPVRLYRHRHNRGLGGALRTGIAATAGEVVLTADCDLSYSIATLERLADTYENTHAEVIIASPYMPGGETVSVPKTLEFRSRMANKWLGLTSLDNLHTITGMVRAYKGSFVRAMSMKATDVDINAEIIYKAQLLRSTIIEIPAVLDWSHLQTRAGRSRLLAKRARANTVKQLINGYLWRPFLFPLLAGVLLLFPALILTAMGRVGLESIAVICWTAGLLLTFQMLSTLQAKRYFEELYFQNHGLRTVLPCPPPMADMTGGAASPSDSPVDEGQTPNDVTAGLGAASEDASADHRPHVVGGDSARTSGR